MEAEIGPKECLYCDRGPFMRSEIRNRHIREKHPDKVINIYFHNIYFQIYKKIPNLYML